MRVGQLVEHLDVLEFDVQELVDGTKSAFYRDVVFKFHSYLVVDEGFEEAAKL